MPGGAEMHAWQSNLQPQQGTCEYTTQHTIDQDTFLQTTNYNFEKLQFGKTTILKGLPPEDLGKVCRQEIYTF